MLKQRTSFTQKPKASCGQLDLPVISYQQWNADITFEKSDLLTERWLSNVKPFRRPRKIELLRNSDKIPKTMEVSHACHIEV